MASGRAREGIARESSASEIAESSGVGGCSYSRLRPFTIERKNVRAAGEWFDRRLSGRSGIPSGHEDAVRRRRVYRAMDVRVGSVLRVFTSGLVPRASVFPLQSTDFRVTIPSTRPVKRNLRSPSRSLTRVRWYRLPQRTSREIPQERTPTSRRRRVSTSAPHRRDLPELGRPVDGWPVANGAGSIRARLRSRVDKLLPLLLLLP